MIFSLLITGAPYSSQSVATALQFAREALQQGHSIHRVFFYADAVHTGSKLATPPQDEMHIPDEWQQLAKDHELDLVVCIAAAVRRGVLDDGEAKRHEKPAGNLQDNYQLSGLGQLVEAAMISDRMITFAP
ncbi:sulfurtransferase complex subunit TusD [Aliamphritea spongicola]|uniref:sulfurtransferase complex subunit TusD n=1 Tax=Aliamphritea spongicola TaxID=707589 RepID=UPI00196B5C96|nr:sulfurtransferase complex subunit TusD [Aliamphritea spongicola]MBN3561245.1 sulfurtransferase complex subunit TusD [Aliamphritea spongicola]